MALIFLSCYKIQVPLQYLYRADVLTLLALTLACPGILRVAFSRYGLLMTTTLGVLLVYLLIGHGDQRLVRSVTFLAYGFACFFVGFRMGIVRNRRYHLIFLSGNLVLNRKSYLWDMLSIDYHFEYGVSRKDMGYAMEMGDDLNPLIMHFPLLAFVVIAGMALYDWKSFMVRVVVIFCQILLSVAVVISTFSAAVIILLAGLTCIVAFSAFAGRVKIRRLLLVTILISSIGGGFLYTVKQSDPTSQTAMKGERVLNLFTLLPSDDNFIETLDEISGTRVTLARMSLRGFAESPFFGIGDREADYEYIGGHSGVFDTMSYYGIVGAIPLWGFLIGWTIVSLVNLRNERQSWFNVATVSLFMTFIASCVLNPYVLHGTIDYLVFFMGGACCGRHCFGKRLRAMSRHGNPSKNPSKKAMVPTFEFGASQR